MDDLDYAERGRPGRHRGGTEQTGSVWQQMAAWEQPGDPETGWPHEPQGYEQPPPWGAPPAEYDAGYEYADPPPPPGYPAYPPYSPDPAYSSGPPYPPYSPYSPYPPQAYGPGMAGLDMLRLDQLSPERPAPDPGPVPRPGRHPGEGDDRGAGRKPGGRPARRRPPAETSLIAGYRADAEPARGPQGDVPRASRPPATGPHATQLLDAQPDAGGAPEPAASYGRTLPAWLPFGRRLVLLPKGGTAAAGSGEPERRDVGDGLRPAVFGAMDGLVTNASLIAGIGGGGGGHGAIVATGVAGLIAGAFSMATGEYISVKSQNELTQAEVDRERRQHARDRKGRLDKLAQAFVGKGVSPNLAQAVATQISADPERAVAEHVREDLGLDPDDLPSPVTAAVASLISFTIGALVPLAPFLLGFPVLWASLVLAGLCAFGGGAAVARLTGRPMALGGLRQFAAAFVATDMAFVLGRLIGGHV